jgi:hypothetical protein
MKIIESFYRAKRHGYTTEQIFYYLTDKGYCYKEYEDESIPKKRIKASYYKFMRDNYMQEGAEHE